MIAHDFFTSQPHLNLSTPESSRRKLPSIYLLRAILHNWSDKDARAILSQLRRASSPSTRLVLGEFAIPHACVDDSECAEIIGGFRSLLDSDSDESEEIAQILLPNLGSASACPYYIDLSVRIIVSS